MLGPPARFVGRGGEKLAGALDRFGIDVRSACAASTPVPPPAASPTALLQAGAASVVAVDVGRGQLHERLRADARVDVARADRHPPR